MKNKTIRVAEAHITEAICKDSHHCMIADAIQTAIPDAQYIRVDLQGIHFSLPKKGVRYTYLTPVKAQHALLKFDAGDRTLKPFSFQLPAVRLERPMGWAAKHPGALPGTSRKYKPTGKKRAYVTLKTREFGLRTLVPKGK